MRIAIASGKGGTGKTTIATSLALSLADRLKVCYFDCDVEAPNGHIFLKPNFSFVSQANIPIPQIDAALCRACGHCVSVCQFHALAKIGNNILVFPQLCHGCGSCTLNCPAGAISEVPNPIGVLETGVAMSGIEFFQGRLTISEPMATPIIRQLKKLAQPRQDAIEIYDAPPGASCSVVETLKGVDRVLLVTEPTPFGLHDLKQVLGILREMKLPAGVIINRDGIGDQSVEQFCTKEGLPILMRIPISRKIAESISRGVTLVEMNPELLNPFQNLIEEARWP